MSTRRAHARKGTASRSKATGEFPVNICGMWEMYVGTFTPQLNEEQSECRCHSAKEASTRWRRVLHKERTADLLSMRVAALFAHLAYAKRNQSYATQLCPIIYWLCHQVKLFFPLLVRAFSCLSEPRVNFRCKAASAGPPPHSTFSPPTMLNHGSLSTSL